MKKYSKFLAIMLVFAMILPGIAQAAPVAGSTQVERVAGAGREETAIAASKVAYPTGATNVVLAGYAGEVDALTGTLLANEMKAPLLLTRAYKLTDATKAELTRLGAKKVYILGGEKVVEPKVVTELEAMNITVERIDGDNRYETAVMAGEKSGAQTKKVFLAKGLGILADALAVGPASAKEDMPVLLTQTDMVPEATMKALKDWGVTHITLVGGTSAISAKVETELKAMNITVDRVEGSDREKTAVAIADKYFAGSKNVIVANGYVYADALVGGYLGALQNAPIVLVDTNVLKASTEAHLAKADMAWILGGVNAVNDATALKVVAAVDDTAMELKVMSVSAINANELKVTFNNKVMKSSAETAGNYTFTAATPSAQGVITPTDIQLQEDGKSVIVRFATADLIDATKYEVEIENVLGEDYVGNTKYEGSFTFSEDVMAPSLQDVKVEGTDLLLTFNEEIDFATTVLRVDGNPIALGGATAPTDAGDYEYIVDATGTVALAKGTHTLTLVGLKDKAGNEAGTITKTYTVSDDTTAPVVSKIEAVDEDTFKVTFSEPVTQPTFKTMKGTTEFAATPVEAGPAKVYNVDVANTAGTNNLYETNENSVALKVEISNFKDAAGLFGTTYTSNVTLKKDSEAPKLLNNALNTVAASGADTLITVQFNEAITIENAAKIKVIDPEGIELANAPVLAAGTKGANTAVATTVTGVTPKVGTYKVVFSEGAVEDLAGNKNATVTANAIFESAKTYAVPTSVTPATDNTIVVVYPEEVTNSAINVANYKLDNGAMPAGTTAVFTTAAKDTVKLTLPSTFKVVSDADYKFEITQNVIADSGAIMVANAGATPKTNYVENIQLTDNVAPELVSAKFVLANSGDTTSTQIKLTFNEELAAIGANEASLYNDLLLKVNGQTVAITGNDIVNANDKTITITIPVTNVNQTATISIVPEGTNNSDGLVITDNSGALNEVKAPAVVAVTK